MTRTPPSQEEFYKALDWFELNVRNHLSGDVVSLARNYVRAWGAPYEIDFGQHLEMPRVLLCDALIEAGCEHEMLLSSLWRGGYYISRTILEAATGKTMREIMAEDN